MHFFMRFDLRGFEGHFLKFCKILFDYMITLTYFFKDKFSSCFCVKSIDLGKKKETRVKIIHKKVSHVLIRSEVLHQHPTDFWKD